MVFKTQVFSHSGAELSHGCRRRGSTVGSAVAWSRFAHRESLQTQKLTFRLLPFLHPLKPAFWSHDYCLPSLGTLHPLSSSLVASLSTGPGHQPPDSSRFHPGDGAEPVQVLEVMDT